MSEPLPWAPSFVPPAAESADRTRGRVADIEEAIVVRRVGAIVLPGEESLGLVGRVESRIAGQALA
jgi:hypothetical protein